MLVEFEWSGRFVAIISDCYLMVFRCIDEAFEALTESSI
jgi:hypothetical protein